MNYSQTYVGIIVIVLGWLGLANLVSNTEVSTIVDNVIQIIGVVWAIYGRYRQGDVNLLGMKKGV